MSDNRSRGIGVPVTAVFVSGALMVVAGSLAESGSWIVAVAIAVVAAKVTRTGFRLSRRAAQPPPFSLDPRVNPPLDNRRQLAGSWALMLIAGATMFAAGYLGPEAGWALVVPFALCAGAAIAASYRVDRIAYTRPPRRALDGSLRMHIFKADRRRRYGETSWDQYGKEAAQAVGIVWKYLGVAYFRREVDFRLRKLEGVRLGDLRAVLPLAGLERLETALWQWQKGLIPESGAERRMSDVLRAKAWPASDVRSPETHLLSRLDIPARKAMAKRLEQYEEEGIVRIVSEYPLLEAWLDQRARGARARGLRSPLLNDLIEEVCETGFMKGARETGILDLLPPDP